MTGYRKPDLFAKVLARFQLWLGTRRQRTAYSRVFRKAPTTHAAR